MITGKVLTAEGAVFIPQDESTVDACLNLTNITDSTNHVARVSVESEGSYHIYSNNCNSRFTQSGDYMITAEVWGNNNPFANAIPLKVHIEAGKLIAQDIRLTNPVVIGRILKPDGNALIPPPGSGICIGLFTIDNTGNTNYITCTNEE